MNRTDFYKMYAKEVDISQLSSKEICVTVFDLLFRCINEHDRVYIKGLGTFKKKASKERRIGNLHGDEPIVIPAGERIIFEPYNGVTSDDE